MNKGVKILILLLVFIGSTAIGYILPIPHSVQSKVADIIGTIVKEEPQQPVTTKQVGTIAEPTIVTPPVEAAPVVEEPQVVISVDNVTVYGLRKNNDTDKLSYSCYIKATYPEGSKVQYIAYYSQNGEEKSRTSSSSTIRGLAPVDSGTYEFVVKDLNTGIESPRFAKKGFDKVRKMSREKLENILNNRESLTSDFYHYIVNNVKINTVSIFKSEGYENVAPTCCDHIFNGVKYSSWVVKLSEQPKYNSDNRITEFSIVITKKEE